MRKITLLTFLPVFFIFLVSLPKRLIFPLNGLFAFNYDQGRDFLAVSKIIYEKDLVLIGQTTGLQGVFYGPWWYYFLLPLIFITGGDPQKVAVLFAFVGVLTIISTYLLIKSLTSHLIIPLSLSFVAAVSDFWMWGPINIWNPNLTPLFLVIFIYCLNKISISSRPIYFFILGVSAFLVSDTTASFGVVLAIFLLFSPLIFRKLFLRREYWLTLAGAFLIIFPRILFELKNSFLITKSVVKYLTAPSIYGQELPLIERFTERVFLFFKTFAEAFTRENKYLAALFLLFLLLIVIFLVKNVKYRIKVKKDFVLVYLSLLLLCSFLFFIIYPNTVWDYYLVGVPTIVLIIIAKILSIAYDTKGLRKIILSGLGLLVVLNLHTNLLPPYKATWEGDGGTYNNEKAVMDYIASQKPNSYSIFAYSPAINDYPFDYLASWYVKRGLIEPPQKNQKTMYLIIRESSNAGYLKNGWYGDKTRDKTTVVEKEQFNGDILVEKHVFYVN